ncbi:MAG: di-trans,poly-cis-decaprenylcistransferase [Asgard group archaeon]|nr:di-trans,poly-cis-decaprenylcistransferase [Asgard group archaeon]
MSSLIYKFYEKRLWKQVKNGPKPQHIGVILDGNRRYARKKGMDAKEGHSFGAQKVEELLKWCLRLGIKVITLYVFSTENFNRKPEEVERIMALLVENLHKIKKEPMIVNNKVNVKVIGTRDKLPENILKLINEVEEKTKDYDNYHLNVALSYGGRTEIVDAVKKIITKVQNNELDVSEIDEKMISEHLYTKGLPDPDLIIRTSGEERLSGFLLWQSAYSELYFTDIYWPAFRKIDLWRAIRTFQQRERRFGK